MNDGQSSGESSKIISYLVNPEELAKKVAYILGDSCAAAAALRDLRKRRDEGKEAYISCEEETWVVYTKNTTEFFHKT